MAIYVVSTKNTRPGDQLADYDDEIGRWYHYDSFVSYSRVMVVGDVIVVCGNNKILGMSRVSEIESRNFMKDMNRCPRCRSTEINERKRTLDFRCNKCKEEFAEPVKTKSHCMEYKAYYEKLWTPFPKPIAFSEADLELRGYRTNAIRKLESLSGLIQLAQSCQEEDLLMGLLCSPTRW